MKLLVNVARELLDDAMSWTACEGVKLREEADGSFTLVMAKDLAAVRESDERIALAERDIAKMPGTTKRQPGPLPEAKPKPSSSSQPSKGTTL